MKNRVLTILLATLVFAGCSTGDSGDAAMDRFCSDLLGKMTLEEKIGQLNLPVAGRINTGEARNSGSAARVKAGEVGGFLNVRGAATVRELQQLAVDSSRLGIPLLFGLDVIHGYETVFPIPLGLSCTWDMEEVEESARIAAVEASSDGISWTFSPMVDIGRDPRWGRVAEGSGEDPFLGCAVARAMVLGYQGQPGSRFTRPDEIMACVKHFALYGAAEGGRDYNTADMSRTRMFNDYLPPYKAAVDAGAGSVMASFNVVDDVPATVNKWLMTDVLRGRWGFGGFVVTDYTGIAECVPHGMGDIHQVSVRALDAGIDMDMVSEAFLTQLMSAVKDGEISESRVDAACRRILEAKYRLGLFEDPYKFCREEEAALKLRCDAHRAAARRIAADSFVLLRNEEFKGRKVLPLEKKGTVAVIGPLANTSSNMPGTWSVAARLSECTTLIDGLREELGDKVKFLYAKGSNVISDLEVEKRGTLYGRDIPRDGRSDAEMLREALAVARQADVVVAAVGESSEMSGETASRSDIGIPDVQQTLLRELLKTGKPVVLLLFNGRPLSIEWESGNVPAILDVWFGGSETAYAVADVLFGDVNPSGKLTISFPRNIGQIPLYYSHRNTGRPLPEGEEYYKRRSCYIDGPSSPLYPFGYGLSYTAFEYGPVTLSSGSMTEDGSIRASVTVTNTGSVAGREVVQMYIQDVFGSLSRPVRELKGFEKISLEPGESKTVGFDITADLLRYYDNSENLILEPGDFNVFIGPDSRTGNKASFVLN